MKIGFVGAGKAGFTLGRYFKEKGANVTGYYSRSLESAKEAAVFTNTKYFETLEQVLLASDTLFLTVPDTTIEIVWNNLRLMPIQNKIICHCSGMQSSAVFDGIEQRQAFGYSVHPLFAIYSKQSSYKEIAQAVFTIEGNDQYLHTLKQFIEQLGNLVNIITPEQKIKYHGAAVFLSNHVTAIAHIGSKLLNECGFEDEFVKISLKTLFLNQCKAIAEVGPAKALTGPVERNDLSTMKKHMECFGENETRLYGLLSKQLIEIAKEKHTDSDYSAMELFIKKELER